MPKIRFVEHVLQVRTGLGSKRKYALEKLFRKYGVDLQFTGHQHSYERTWPIFNYTVRNVQYSRGNGTFY